MYAYRKSMPRANKHLEEKWVKHCQKLHRKRLTQMKPAIDNKTPQRFAHLDMNMKKQQMDEERYSQIERDNYLLLDKMSYIMTHPQLLDEKYMGRPVTYGKSLNKEYRKRELMRITEENQQILRRIQHKEPHYSNESWTEQARRDEEYLKNCAEYPICLPSSLQNASPPSRVTRTPRSRMTPREMPQQQRQEAQGGYAVQVQEQETDEALRLPSRQGREPVLSKVQEEEADAAAASADAAGAKAAQKDEEVMDVEGDNS